MESESNRGTSDIGGWRLRRLSDPEQLRALAHPRRMELIDLLIAEGPLTATKCGQRLGDSAASCSYHLRQLARYGFVEEAPGSVGRQRPWQWVPIGNRIERGARPAQQAAAAQLMSVLDARNIDRVRRYRAAEGAEPWADLASSSDWVVSLTADELRELGEQIGRLLAPFQQRTASGEAPADSRLVDAISYLLPRPARTRPGHDRGEDPGAAESSHA